MPLSHGVRLGPYEILDAIGAGGMGEVYRARDTRLERTVAIKILPAHLSGDPLQKQRFEREAKTVSSLNHPHICVLYDVGSQDGVDYLVMECVEGETLAKRLEKSALPLEQVLKYGMQIADALDKAHRSGVVHRDLKPGNIMLTQSGAKLLDFGLAKPAAPLTSLATLTATATKQSPATEQGTIVGTFQYMSPEQIEGKDLDGRSDNFSLGTVLYEMLAGQRAFPGKSQLSVASAILEKEPAPITTIKPMTPPALDHAIRRCLAKEPEERWQTARDLMLELKWIAETDSQAAIPSVATGKLAVRLGWALAGFAGFLALVFGIGYLRLAPAPGQAVRAFILPPPKTTFTSVGIDAGPITVSPDGRHLVFAAADDSGSHLLWVRPTDSVTPQPLPGTEGGAWPFWSPDGRYLAFFVSGKLKKMEISGGPAETLCDALGGRGGSWSGDGTILFAPSTQSSLYRVSETGGTPSPVTKLDESRHDISHRWPDFLPDGQHFIFFARGGQSGIYSGMLGSQETKLVMASEAEAAFAKPGYLLFWREGSLMAQPFDTDRVELTGKAVPIADHVLFSRGQSFGVFSVSQNGVLALQAGDVSGTQLSWFDRTGRQLSSIGGDRDLVVGPRLSPDGRKLAMGIFVLGTHGDIWVYDLSRDVRTRFTFESGRATQPVWSPDGSQIAFLADREGQQGIYVKSLSGEGNGVALLQNQFNPYPSSWSPDGRFLAYYRTDQTPPISRRQIWVLPLFGDRKPFPFLPSTFDENTPEFSPDGRWIAYESSESGTFQIYVAAFPGAKNKAQVSPSGGTTPAWRADGKELFYVDPIGRLMAVDVKAVGDGLQLGTPRTLFLTHAASAAVRSYDVSRAGDRFMITTTGDVEPSPYTLVVNWTAEMRKE